MHGVPCQVVVVMVVSPPPCSSIVGPAGDSARPRFGGWLGVRGKSADRLIRLIGLKNAAVGIHEWQEAYCPIERCLRYVAGGLSVV